MSREGRSRNGADSLPPAAQREHPVPLFKWETLREVEVVTLRYASGDISGKTCEVELLSGEKVRGFRANDGRQYFCHALTFGAKEAPGGIFSPYGDHVPTILRRHYERVTEAEVQPGDILVWRGLDADDIVHSAILTDPIRAEGTNYLDLSATLRTKNGIEPETDMTLRELIENHYGESFSAFRRKKEG